MQGVCAAHWQATLAALAAAGGMHAVAAAGVETERTMALLLNSLASVAKECSYIVAPPFEAVLQEACSLIPQVTKKSQHPAGAVAVCTLLRCAYDPWVHSLRQPCATAPFCMLRMQLPPSCPCAQQHRLTVGCHSLQTDVVCCGCRAVA